MHLPGGAITSRFGGGIGFEMFGQLLPTSASLVIGAVDDGIVLLDFLTDNTGELGTDTVLFERRKLDDGLNASFCFRILLPPTVSSLSDDGISEFCGTGTLPNSASSILLKYNSRAAKALSKSSIVSKYY